MFIISQSAMAKICRQASLKEYPKVAEFLASSQAGQENPAYANVGIIIVDGYLMPSGLQAYSCYFDGNETDTMDVLMESGDVVPVQGPGSPCIMISQPLCQDSMIAETCIVHEMAHFFDKGKETDPASTGYHESGAESFARSLEAEFMEFSGYDQEAISKFLNKKYGNSQ